MPNYSSKSQKRSQSKSKNGGRRRKRTLKNVRRRKSRKVMRGGDRVDVLIKFGLPFDATPAQIDETDKKYNGKLKKELINVPN